MWGVSVLRWGCGGSGEDVCVGWGAGGLVLAMGLFWDGLLVGIVCCVSLLKK